MNISGKQRVLGLDAFRTIAIVGVTLFHMFPTILPGGYFGVSMFFVLTGYLLAFTCERERLDGRFSLLNYYWKRFKRIYPSLIIVLLSTIGVYHFLAPKVIEAVRPEIISVLLGYNNWWQIFQHADYFAKINNNSPFTHLWFMGIELQYYLCWPILFLIYDLFAELGLRKAGIGFVTILGIGFSVLMPVMYHYNLDITRLYYGTDSRVYALLFGAVLGLIHAGRQIKTVNIKDDTFLDLLKFTIFGLCLGVTCIAYKLLDGQNPLVYQGGMIVMTLIFCLMIVFIADDKLGLGRYLENPLFNWIGKHSYGIFLWQYPVIFLFNYLEWNKMPTAPLIEFAAILLLTMWSDSVSESLMRRQLPSIGKRMILTQGMLFLTITFVGTILMGFGCRSLVVSAKVKTDTVELKTRIEANKTKVEEQNKKNKAELALQIQQEIVTQSVYEEPKKQNSNKKVDLNGVSFIGDSIMLDAADEIQRYLPNCYINAEVSRHIYDGLKAIKFFEAQGCLGKTVVIGLGTNEEIGYYNKYKEHLNEILQYLGPYRQVFLINLYDGSGNYEWQRLANEYIKKLSKERSNVEEIDWNSFIAPHPEWLWGDVVHPNVEGSKEYAKLIYENLTGSN